MTDHNFALVYPILKNNGICIPVIVEKTKSMRHMNLVTARATVTPDNSDYKEIFNHLNELEFRAIPIAIAQNMVDDEQFDKILSEYINYIFISKSLF